ncbi:MAG: pyrroloquinoline quinone-dependent dehydrogenase [Rhodospirillaceae bacterium]|jgi:quinoprotein glucose dehydrogenase|nr:pyrroloquinoline quinone-dependent dehydrogenase [Rhodospirillaceae bacterium]MBT5567264.1 pyrroloquinoline quinone-dependent dehydrogenase [Rhodospirillaceae bacterium]MBT6962439.1 pyrroloquinoline quinone-dependent dehydrogenase [Rhodospirillaceae bacterium]MBT7451151.1 pyrroloquinoline quinone-dependent dehydrogenase [Rhodospirillaceae bacterium]
MPRRHTVATSLALLVAFSVPSLPISADELATNKGWSSFGGVPGGGRYSALDQINRSNVDDLELAWTYHTGETTDFGSEIGPSYDETTPILANDLLYLCTAHNRIIALDPALGTEVWAFNPHDGLIDTPLKARHCRGVGYWQNENPTSGKACEKRVFKGDRIGNVFAVDANTGKACEDFGRGGYLSLSDYEYNGEGLIDLTSPPVILNDLVIIGGGVGDSVRANSPDGTIRAFDVRSGEERWHFNTIPEAMRDQTGGGDIWPPFTVDTERNWVFVPTGSPSPDPYGGNRLDPIPYANAIVVLDGETGELVWHKQLVHHDVFDYDLPAQPTLIDIRQGDEVIEAVAQVTKMGTVFVFRRDNGEPVFPIEEIPVPQTDIPEERTSPTQPWPTKPGPFSGQVITEDDVWGLTFWDRGKCMEEFKSFRYEGIFTPPSLQGSLLYPSTAGGGNWGGVAYDPKRNLLVVKAHNYGFVFRLVPLTSEEAKGKPNTSSMSREMIGTPYRVEGRRWLSPWGIPCNAPPWGELTAFDMTTGETAWRVPFGQVSVGPFGLFKTPKSWGSPNVGGPIITGGDLIFIGAAMDSVLRAIDIETGEEVWATDLPKPGMAVPMTYTAGPDGRQFIVIAATGNGIAGTELGDAYVAYALPNGASK